MKIFCGTANPELGARIAEAVGLTCSPRILEPFPDGELRVELGEPVQGSEVILVQPTSAPTGVHVLELLLLADACWRAGAKRMTAVVPYFGYARQDRRTSELQPLGSRVLADLVAQGRFARLVTVDLHSRAVEGGFSMPLVHCTAVPLLAERLRPSSEGAIVVSPDLGAVKLAEDYARRLGLPMAVVHKTRLSGSEVSARELIGDVAGKRPILVDDMISTGGTIAEAARLLRSRGCADELTVATTHALLVGDAAERLRAAGVTRLVTTDSVARPSPSGLPLDVVSLGPLLASRLRAEPARE